jgi:hypothetical protein
VSTPVLGSCLGLEGTCADKADSAEDLAAVHDDINVAPDTGNNIVRYVFTFF